MKFLSVFDLKVRASGFQITRRYLPLPFRFR